MFGRSTKSATKEPPPARSVRDTLFDDAPLDAWPSDVSAGQYEPWKTFIRARESLAAGDTDDAIRCWQAIAQTPNLESRHYGQARHFLREQGIQPPADQAKRLLGVILEVQVETGHDFVAAYPERNARYYNYTGRGVVWEHPDASLDNEIDALLAAGQAVLNQIGPWKEPRPAPPGKGMVRLNFLAPSGLHFGQAPYEVFEKDPLARPVLAAGIKLMQAMIEKQQQQQRA